MPLSRRKKASNEMYYLARLRARQARLYRDKVIFGLLGRLGNESSWEFQMSSHFIPQIDGGVDHEKKYWQAWKRLDGW